MNDHKPARVMHFIHSLKAGGAERQLGYLIQGSDPGVLTHAVCCFNDEGKEELYSQAEIYKLDRRHKYDFKFREIYQVLSDWNPDIVHNWLSNVLVNSFIPARWFGKSIFVSSYRSTVKLTTVFRFFVAILVLLSDGLVSITAPENLFFPFRQIFQLKRGTTIPIGIPVKEIAAAEPIPLTDIRSSSGDQLLLFVGRLSPEKNIPLLIQGVGRLAGDYPGLKLLLCGEGPEREQLLDIALELGIAERVSFLGYREDIYPIMKACHLLVLPSFREGMGNVLFEALAAGLPAVASKIPALEYWFKDQEIVSLFDPHSLDELTDCIRRELERPAGEKEHRREEAQRLVDGLDIDVMVRKYTDFYHSLYQ